MASKPIWQAVKREGLREIVSGAIRVWLWPPLATGIAVVIGGFQQVPWFYVFVGATVIFAAVSSGLLRFDEWRDRRRVDGKLAFVSVVVGRDIKGRGLIVGSRFQNSATFSVEFEVTEMRTKLGNKVPALEHKATKVTLPPAGVGWCNDNPIELADPPRPGTIEGSIEFRVNYGLPGASLKYSLSGKKQVVAAFNDDGLLTQGSWAEAT